MAACLYWYLKSFDMEKNNAQDRSNNLVDPTQRSDNYKTELETRQEAEQENLHDNDNLRQIKDPELKKTLDSLPPEADLQTNKDQR